MHNALASCQAADGLTAASTPTLKQFANMYKWRVAGQYLRKNIDYRECLHGQILRSQDDVEYDVTTIAMLVVLYVCNNPGELTDAVSEADANAIARLTFFVGERKRFAKAIFECRSKFRDVQEATMELTDSTRKLHRRIGQFAESVEPKTLEIFVRRGFAAMLQNSAYVMRQLGEYCGLIGDAFSIARNQGISLQPIPFTVPAKLLAALNKSRSAAVLRTVADPTQYPVPVYPAGFALYGGLRKIARALDRLPTGSALHLVGASGSSAVGTPQSGAINDRLAAAMECRARAIAANEADRRCLNFEAEPPAYRTYLPADQGTHLRPQATASGVDGSAESSSGGVPSSYAPIAADPSTARLSSSPVDMGSWFLPNASAVERSTSDNGALTGSLTGPSAASTSAGKQRLLADDAVNPVGPVSGGQVAAGFPSIPATRYGDVPPVVTSPPAPAPQGGQESLASPPDTVSHLVGTIAALSPRELQAVLNVISSQQSGQALLGAQPTCAGGESKPLPSPSTGVPVQGLLHGGVVHPSKPVQAYTTPDELEGLPPFDNALSQELWESILHNSPPRATMEAMLSIRCLCKAPSTGIMFKQPSILSILQSPPREDVALKIYMKNLLTSLTPALILAGCPEPNAEGSIAAYVEFRPRFVERCLQWVLILNQTTAALHLALVNHAATYRNSAASSARWTLLSDTTSFESFFERLDGLYSDSGFAHSDDMWISATKRAHNVLELFQNLRPLLETEDRCARARREILKYLATHYGQSSMALVSQFTLTKIDEFDACESILRNFVDAYTIVNPAQDTPREDAPPSARQPKRGGPSGGGAPAGGIPPDVLAAYLRNGMLNGPRPMYDLPKVYEYLGLDTTKIPDLVGPHQDGTHGEECLVCSQIFKLEFCYFDQCRSTNTSRVAYHKAWSCKRIEKAVKQAAEQKGDGPEVVAEVLKHLQSDRASSSG